MFRNYFWHGSHEIHETLCWVTILRRRDISAVMVLLRRMYFLVLHRHGVLLLESILWSWTLSNSVTIEHDLELIFIDAFATVSMKMSLHAFGYELPKLSERASYSK